MDVVINTQLAKDKTWTDETGMPVPYARTHAVERLKEKLSAQLVRKALKMQETLTAFKQEIEEDCKEIHKKFLESIQTKAATKGNFTWFNFDRSIKVQMSVNVRIDFDDLGIQACKLKLDEFLENKLSSTDEFIKQMVMDAFETSRGQLDAKKVLSLLKYKSKIKAKKFLEAMKLLEDSIRRPDSKTYYRIWVKDSAGEYQTIDLNFSSI